MEINYNLPLELNCLCVKQRQTGNGIQSYVEIFKVYIQWEDIIGMEQFINHEQFPEDDQDIEKVTLITKQRPYIIRENIEVTANNWAHYKIWKSKQVIKPLFSIN